MILEKLKGRDNIAFAIKNESGTIAIIHCTDYKELEDEFVLNNNGCYIASLNRNYFSEEILED
jgi:hypothetical protein